MGTFDTINTMEVGDLRRVDGQYVEDGKRIITEVLHELLSVLSVVGIRQDDPQKPGS